jgi:thermitase
MTNRPTLIAAAIIILAIIGGVVGLMFNLGKSTKDLQSQAANNLEVAREDGKARSAGIKATPADLDFENFVASNSDSNFANSLMDRLLKLFLANKSARRGEANLKFKNADVMEKFLAQNFGSGFRILGRSDKLGILSVKFDKAIDLFNALAQSGLSDGDLDISANYVVSFPTYPGPDAEIPAQADAQQFGYNLLDYLGVTGDNSEWGKGVKIAIIDGIVQNPESLNGNITVHGQAGTEIDPADGHGKAVTSIISGSDTVPGIAPSSIIDNYPVLDTSGNGGSYDLATAIMDAVGNGSKILNISLGSEGDSPLVRDAIAYAIKHGALVIAAAGNDGANSLSYPAAYEGVIGVGAFELKGEILDFSNFGEGLDIAAPGYGIPAVWPGEDQAISFSGTSAAAPITTASLAAIMSIYGVGAYQAYDMLVSYANEAGAPGLDAYHGVGNIAPYRVFNGANPGINDLAVSSNYLDQSNLAFGGNPVLQVTLENRGTNTVNNSQVSVKNGVQLVDFPVNSLAPGQTFTYDVSIDMSNVTPGGNLQISSGIDFTGGGSDSRFFDNRLNSIIPVK